MPVIFLTTTGAGNWTVPADFGAFVSVEAIGGGGAGRSGGASAGAGGGGGGAYSKLTSGFPTVATPGVSTIAYSVGAGGTAGFAGNDTWFGATTTLLAKAGSTSVSVSGGPGGASSTGVGNVKTSGGAGGVGNTQATHFTGGGGGGAGGPGGTGGLGGNGDATTTGNDGGGGSGAGAGLTTAGGAGNNGNGTSGGGAGTNATGGANGVQGGDHGLAGLNNTNQGTLWTSTLGVQRGPGGGGSGSGNWTGGVTRNGGAGGTFGGGGGGGTNGGTGGDGVIVITYNTETTPPTITSTASHSTPENTLYSATATANETVTWAKGGTDAALVTLNTNTGEWSVAAVDLDYETRTSVSFTLTATDLSGNASTAQTVTLTITDVSEGTAWTPNTTDVPGLLAWWTRSAGVGTSGGNVMTWTDQIGGRVLSKGGAGDVTIATTAEGKSALSFTGGGALLSGAVTDFPEGTEGHTVVAVVRKMNSHGAGTYRDFFAWGSTSTNSIRSFGTNGNNFGHFFYGNDHDTTIDMTPRHKVIVGKIAAGASPLSSVKADGATAVTDTRVTLTTPGSTTFTVSLAGAQAMEVQHIFVCAGELSPLQIKLLEGYCTWDCGLQANFASGHAYTAASPKVLWKPDLHLLVQPKIWTRHRNATWSGSNLSSITNAGTASTTSITPTGVAKGASQLGGYDPLAADASGDRIRYAGIQAFTSGKVSVFHVHKSLGKTTWHGIISGPDGWAQFGKLGVYVNDAASLGPFASGNGYDGFAGAGAGPLISGLADTPTGTWRQHFVQLGTTNIVRHNGTVQTPPQNKTAAAPSYASGYYDVLNVDGGGEVLNGEAAEVMMWDDWITSDEYARLEGAFAHEYDLIADLDAGHTYKLTPPAAPAATALTGTLSATESGSDTASFTGTVALTGTLAATETGADTAAFTGTISSPGTLAATETGSDTAAFAGTVDYTGTLAATESGSDTAALTGTVVGLSPSVPWIDGFAADTYAANWTGDYWDGSASQPLDSAKMAITRVVTGGKLELRTSTANNIGYPFVWIPIDGFTIGQTYQLSIDFTMVNSGWANISLDDGVNPAILTSGDVTTAGTYAPAPFVATSTGYWLSLGNDRSQSSDRTVQYDNLSITEVAASFTGTLAATETGSDTAAASGTVTVTGTLAATESGSDTAAMTGTVAVTGTLAATESGTDTAAATGTVADPRTGTLAATESGSDTAAFTGTVSTGTTGTLSATESGSDTAAMTGTVVAARTGTLAATESGADSATITGTVAVTGTVAATESGSDSATFTGTVVVPVTGTLSATETGSDSAAFDGTTANPVTGTLAATEDATQDTATIEGATGNPITGTVTATESSSDSAVIKGDIRKPYPRVTGMEGKRSIEIPFRWLVTREDPDYDKDRRNEPEYVFGNGRRQFTANRSSRGAYDGQHNETPPGWDAPIDA